MATSSYTREIVCQTEAEYQAAHREAVSAHKAQCAGPSILTTDVFELGRGRNQLRSSCRTCGFSLTGAIYPPAAGQPYGEVQYAGTPDETQAALW